MLGGEADLAAGWYFEHMEDPDINDPLPAAGAAQWEEEQHELSVMA